MRNIEIKAVATLPPICAIALVYIFLVDKVDIDCNKKIDSIVKK